MEYEKLFLTKTEKKRENFAKSLVLRCNKTRDDMRRSISPHFLPNFYILPKFALNFDFSKFLKKFFFIKSAILRNFLFSILYFSCTKATFTVNFRCKYCNYAFPAKNYFNFVLLKNNFTLKKNNSAARYWLNSMRVANNLFRTRPSVKNIAFAFTARWRSPRYW